MLAIVGAGNLVRAEAQVGEPQAAPGSTSFGWWHVTALALLVSGAGLIHWRRVGAARREAARLREANANLEQRVKTQSERLAVLTKELEALSYSVSHDLRAPLRTVNGFSRAIVEDYWGKLDDEGKDNLSRIREASQHMEHLIDGLLSLSRIAREELRAETIDLSALVVSVTDELRKANPNRPLEFAIEPNLSARGDTKLLRIALENLLGNACKFSGKCAVARIQFGATTRNGARAFFVRDNGSGFDLTYARKLFGAFQRYHAAAEFPGLGIGLAMTQRIIHRHGGEIIAESKPDEGATFYFTLPEPLTP